MIEQFATMRVPAEIFLDPLYNPYVANQGLSHSHPEVPKWLDRLSTVLAGRRQYTRSRPCKKLNGV